MVAAEGRPFATTGGLSEVMHGLPRALARLGHRVTIVLPLHRRAKRALDASAGSLPPAEDSFGEVLLGLGPRTQPVRFLKQALPDGVSAVFVDAPDLFDREGLYGTPDGDYADNAYRFAVLSRAALEFVRRAGERPSVLHAHDWHAGLVPAYQKMLFSGDPVVGGVPAVFTIHNLAFQGVYPASVLADIGLPPAVLHVQAMEYWGGINYLKAGINFSERITTVSPRYAREILTPELGFGLDGVLSRRAGSLVGILNGIDTTRWNPAADPHLPEGYSASNLAAKAQSKQALLAAAGLPATAARMARPLVGMVSRLTDQKGFDLIAAAAADLLALDATWVVLGSGERRYEDLLRTLAGRHPDRLAVSIGFDDRLEHLIEAGADAFLMPSRFEPCGLNQLNSLRYGTLPIVRATGGLDDTVRDEAADGEAANGFKFAGYTPAALVEAVRRALRVFADRDRWARMQRAAMQQDYSWDVSAREYVKVYEARS
jgi:starch synthase